MIQYEHDVCLLIGSSTVINERHLSFTDMAEPIQQLTTNNEGRSNRESVPFNLLTHKEKVHLFYTPQYHRDIFIPKNVSIQNLPFIDFVCASIFCSLNFCRVE